VAGWPSSCPACNGKKIELAHLKRKHPRLTKVAKVLYFRKNKGRMHCAQWKREGFMIGSGVVEAACKTLVAQISPERPG
jgi:hypothetical protein